MILGIDAHCLRAGGGITHLHEVLRVAEPAKAGFSKVVIWSGKRTLDSIDDRPWLEKTHQPMLDRDLLRRSYWSSFVLPKLASAAGCDVLWVPGCSFAGAFRPFVAMSRNMLPFEPEELRRYGWSRLRLKFVLLRRSNLRTYRRADGMIYLSQYARTHISAAVGAPRGDSRVIPHGVDERFTPPSSERSVGPTVKLLYVSSVDLYKHQWNVVAAVERLQKAGVAVDLTLIGSALSNEGATRLRDALAAFAGKPGSVRYLGKVKYSELPQYYREADMFVFASSCENLPNILLEAMATGLPIASSSYGPMPEVLGDGGVYFDPENPDSIAHAVRQLIDSPVLQREKASIALQRSHEFSWRRCADQSFDYLREVATRTSRIASVE